MLPLSLGAVGLILASTGLWLLVRQVETGAIGLLLFVGLFLLGVPVLCRDRGSILDTRAPQIRHWLCRLGYHHWQMVRTGYALTAYDEECTRCLARRIFDWT